MLTAARQQIFFWFNNQYRRTPAAPVASTVRARTPQALWLRDNKGANKAAALRIRNKLFNDQTPVPNEKGELVVYSDAFAYTQAANRIAFAKACESEGVREHYEQWAERIQREGYTVEEKAR